MPAPRAADPNRGASYQGPINSEAGRFHSCRKFPIAGQPQLLCEHFQQEAS